MTLGHADHPKHLANLGCHVLEWGSFHKHLGDILMHRFMMFLTRPDLGRGADTELDLAIEAQEVALQFIPSGNPNRAMLLAKTSATLSARFEITNDPADLQKLLDCLQKGVNCHHNEPRVRINMAKALGVKLIESSNYVEASQVLEQAVRLLPMACSRSSSSDDKQEFLKSCYGLASMSAGTLLSAGKSPSYALEILEAGRGVVAGLFLDTRTDLHELKRKHPELASKFELLGEQLNSDPDLDKTPFEARTNVHIGQSTTTHMNRRIILQHDFDELVATIRGQPGLSDFLLPASTTEMMKAASHGPIAVINVSLHRCDAIIIERQQIGSIPLPHMHYVQVDDLAQKLRDLPFESHSSKFLLPLLEWLWAVAAHPILEYLGISHPPKDDNWPHIWWIPTGALTHLPIHAAGIHGKKSHETVMDRAISSYASSVKSLIHSRQGTIQNDVPEIQHALLVSMLNTPNQDPLPFAVDEIKAIKPLIHTIGLTPAHCKEQESTNEMLELMKSSKILHFAGHGMSHASNPSKSCLLTIDWESNPLTVERLRQESLQDASPFLAYLSSCSTGAVRIHNMADESIHLINSCQLAGFRHVIGALWEVSDPHCVKVAKVVYEVLKEEGLNDETVAKGLHRATRNIRDSCLDVTLRECSFSREDYNDEIKKSLKEQLENLERDFEAFGIFNRESSVVKQRDAVLIETPPHREKQTDSFLWVPYIYYGA
ncbi:uncharacterized protein N7484_007616 [Penicillium longicatenatum]|uniref:uncharacterized protein n=1 Tax=Penicillium longicatenatum TaxID=1561947 RepID=UPI00254993CB|nr:uncharacterized protein N7484_007616 [Penicillium longicatenatum]KAJ5639754.1 hypothetical protein N7484_007616 [Penicillium longicatenatum]